MAWCCLAGLTALVFAVVLAGTVCAGAVLPAGGLVLCADAAIGKDRARRLKAVAAAMSLRMSSSVCVLRDPRDRW